MYKCLDCEAEFEEVAKVREPHGEHLSHCPSCGSDDFVELKKCHCGEHYNSEEDYCDACLEAGNDALDLGLKWLKKMGYERSEGIDLLVKKIEEAS